MVPSSGDLHIARADFSDALQPFSCTVRNKLNGREETSQPATIVINGEWEKEQAEWT